MSDSHSGWALQGISTPVPLQMGPTVTAGVRTRVFREYDMQGVSRLAYDRRREGKTVIADGGAAAGSATSRWRCWSALEAGLSKLDTGGQQLGKRKAKGRLSGISRRSPDVHR